VSVSPPRDRALCTDEEILGAARTLGAASGMATTVPRLLTKLRDPNLHGKSLANFICTEPVLVARVLRVANSAYYHHQTRVASVERAISILGSDAVRSIATVVALDALIDANHGTDVFIASALRRHSLASALLGRYLAQICCPDLVVDAFLAALMHDLGHLLQVRLRPRGFAQMRMTLNGVRQPMTGSALRAVEEEHVGVAHERCIEIVFRDWKLPEALAVGVGFHHSPMAAPEELRSLAALTHLSANLASQRGDAAAQELFVQELCKEAQQWLGLRDVDLRTASNAGLSGRCAWEDELAAA